MAKTKRTVEEAEVAAAAAANSDSKLITRGSLNRFATKFWDKIKDKYDVTFKAARITDEKKLIFTKTNNSEDELSLSEYARLKDKNDFKQDVSADNVAILSNSHIGTTTNFLSMDRGLGFRQLTTSTFVDGYVDHIRIYLEDSVTGNATFKVWAIKKGANRDADRVGKVIHQAKSLEVNSLVEGSTTKKFVIIPIEQSFTDETYFIVKCSTHVVKVADNIKPEYRGDIVNLNNVQPPDNPNSEINWGANADGANTAIMYLYGRESIGSLALKVNKVSPDSGLYVKQEETTNTGGATNPNKVVRLDNTGKLNKDMLPSIAINEYFQIEQFTHEKLNLIKDQFENGDVVVVTGNGANHGKRFLCVNKQDITDLRECFIELNSKDGSVVSVNRKTGAVNLTLETADDKLKLKITGGGGDTDVTETTVDIITNNEIDAIIDGLTD